MNYIIIIILLLVIITGYMITTKMISPTISVRKRLDDLCPLSISETRNGIVYINPTNGATRDDYLFSGCTSSGTCDTSTLDPVSENILNNIKNCHCGCWVLGDYSWDPVNKKWIKK